MQAVRHYLLAVQFFTRVPITGRLAEWVGYSPAMLRAAGGHFPGVGWLVAALAVLVYAALYRGLAGGALAALVAAALSTAATVLMTGGFHEDGLADVADGLGGASTPERAMEIMKDSRLGAFGAMALLLALLTKVALLAQLSPHGMAAPLLALAGAHPLSRLWPLITIRLLPHVGDSATSKSKPLADRISARSLLSALAWCLPPSILVASALGVGALAAAVVVSAAGAAWMHWRYARRLQGFTGDCLGGTQQVAELGFYLGLALALARG
ncbi:adenosylcobinamide-GDP ribazoletransferase [Melaminivora suipulveris]|uniref:Adenosylcobinamide-GDP ribazoletransferase n=1 Tax=Melaminivora suipulveris TaxID=2109913 RepID=A0A2R3QA98_9BURK|nr:adenosylcobinamide-GDP ribazoletransferase [Melaminivora suipulveris]AVO48679.1 adenosylcobinamide-GDP ribazoletransferase [Melaminivora suipulveris]